jgi:FAD/FMN-containing dehydrogenase/Fe-S oxidoreductase
MATSPIIRPEDLVTEARRRDVDADRLAAALRDVVSGEVRFDAGSRALYATDGSNYRQPPIGVVVPRDADDVVRALAVCAAHDAPVFGRGGGTSLAGQCCNAAVCFDMSKYMNRVLAIDPVRRLARVQPGTILDDLRGAAEAYGLTFGPDPSTHNHCTLGGMIGNNSCGVHSVMAQFYGPGPRTSDSVEALDLITYDGTRMTIDAALGSEPHRWNDLPPAGIEIVRRLKALADGFEHDIRDGMPDIPRRVSGYNLTALLPEHGFNIAHAVVGSESTCILILEAVVRLIPKPKARSLLVMGYPSVYEAADDISLVMAHRPIGCEGMDDRLVKDIESVGYESDVLRVLPDGGGFLLVEFGGDDKNDADAKAHTLMAELQKGSNPPAIKLFDDEAEEKKVWKVREAGLGATAHVDRMRPTWEGWEDAAVPPARLGEYLRAFRKLLDDHGLTGDLYGHFGQGCVHTRINFDLQSAAGVAGYRRFVEAAADLVVSLGGSLSGEHGDGQSRAELLPRMYGPKVMAAFHQFKQIWDPRGRMNPGKLIDPYRLDENLRLGAHYNPPALRTHFHYRNESGGFAKATLRCVGVGECRRLHGGTMCPSFRVTREEQHSTRGRARLLFEMLEGDPLSDGWQSREVKEALDLCLACKGCKGECPVSVDMATYKAEFLAHYYQRHWRPITAYAFGLIHIWARLAARMPRLVNAITQAPGLRAIAKLACGMPAARRIPAFAPVTFQQWFARQPRAAAPADSRRVILWPDTFNNHFHPETAIAAVQILERAGCHVDVPAASVCCGRPLFDYGMIDRVRQQLRHVLDAFGDTIDAGVPVIVLEPSCAAVFRDELLELFPDDARATRLSQQTYLLSEWLSKIQAPLPALQRRAIVHGHCHHKAMMKMDAEQEVLERIGLDCTVLDSGCCGMAGSFGFERDHYDVSMKVGELVLLPAVRNAPGETLIVADGFSCRTQIEQATDRRALHLADVLAMAAAEGPHGPVAGRPERDYVPDYATASASAPALIALGALAAVAAVTLIAAVAGRRRRRRPPLR